MREARAVVAACLAAIFVLLLTASPATAERGFLRGFADPLFESTSERARWLDASRSEGASLAKVFVSWREVATSRPDDPANPADPAYDFGNLDATVRAAGEQGLRVLLGVQFAPAWAEGKKRPDSAPAGTWKPDPGEFGSFMEALATRYSGSFSEGLGQQLPRVADFQAWSEPNLNLYLTPQYKGKKLAASDHYKRLLNAAADGVRRVHSDNRVVTAGLAPYGDARGGDRTRPLQFWRDVFCLKGRALKPGRGCAPTGGCSGPGVS